MAAVKTRRAAKARSTNASHDGRTGPTAVVVVSSRNRRGGGPSAATGPTTSAEQVGELRSGRSREAGFPPAGRSADLARIQRARLLAGMVEVVGERGVGNVTVAHVVARAGISRRTFYELFEDREDCFLATFDYALGLAASVVVPAYQARDAWREGIRAALTALLGFLEDEPGLGALLVVDALGAGPRALARRTSVLSVLIETVDQGRNVGKS